MDEQWALVGFGWAEEFIVMLIPEFAIPDALRFDFVVLTKDSDLQPIGPLLSNPRRVADDD